MRKRDRKALGGYCRDLADKLELRDWTVCTAVGDPGGPTNRKDGKRWGASSYSVPGQKRVNLTFTESIRDWAPEEVRQTVAHELIHAHLSPLCEMVREDLAGHIGDQAHDMFDAAFTRHLEFGVEAWAESVAPFLPLIEWP